jgi:hypothetical protein
VILPIWHEVGYREVKNFSPTLADRIASKSEQGLDVVVKRILAVLSGSSEG